MAKKKEEEKKSLPSKQEYNVIISPTELIKLMTTFSPLAMQIFAKLLEQFQLKMVEQLEAKAKNRQYSLFDDEVIPMVRIPMNELPVEAYDYHRIEIAVAELFNQVYHTTVRNEWGDEVDRYIRLFQVCEIPKRKLGYYNDESNEDRYNYKSGMRRRGYIAMQFTQEAAPMVLSIDKAYTKFVVESLNGWRNKYAPGIVLTLSSVMELGAWTVKYDDLRRRLGFIKPVMITDENSKGATNIYTEKDFGYSNFSDMKRRVLDPVMKEVSKGCEEGRSVPFFFEYEPNYVDGKTRGIPKSITFKIHKSEFGRMMETENKRSREKTEIREFLIKHLKIGRTSAAALSSLVNDDNLVEFRKKMEELYKFISDSNNTIKDVGAYCVVALKNWIESNGSTILDKSPTIDAEYTEVVADETDPAPTPMNPQWDAALIKMQLTMPSNVYRTISECLGFVSYTDGTLMLSYTDKRFFEWLEGEGGIADADFEMYAAAIKEAFGDNTQVNYVFY